MDVDGPESPNRAAFIHRDINVENLTKTCVGELRNLKFTLMKKVKEFVSGTDESFAEKTPFCPGSLYLTFCPNVSTGSSRAVAVCLWL